MNDSGCEPVFIISVAARLLEMHPQTLRKYEREGLIAPSRTTGNLRLYSDDDLERLRQVKYLVGERGLNLAGVQLVLELTRHLRAVQRRLGEEMDSRDDPALERLQAELNELMAHLGAGDYRARLARLMRELRVADWRRVPVVVRWHRSLAERGIVNVNERVHLH